MKSNNLWSQLFKAAEVGDFEKCKVILEKNHNKNSPNQVLFPSTSIGRSVEL